MSKPRIIRYALIAFLLLTSTSFAETREIKLHKVIKHDTLWDISKKELNDPYLWPAIWKENRWIANPHWIYPGQTIKIPIYLLQKEKPREEAAPKPAEVSEEPVQEEVKKEPVPVPVTKHPLVSMNTLMASGYIADTIPGVGAISDSAMGQPLFGNDDIVYVTVERPAKVGDKFYVIEASEEIEHPITGKDIGYLISICGVVEIVKVKKSETLAKITKCFREININDALVPYYDVKLPMTTGHFRSPRINGMVIATSNSFKASTLDIIYIDKGCKDGIEAGDIFKTLAVDTHAVQNGVIQVISCRDHTATAIIKSSNMPVSPGNIFTRMDKN